MPSVIDFDRSILNRAAPQGFKMDRKAAFSAENKAGKLTIRLYDAIGPDWIGMIGAETIARILDDAGNVKTIDLRINSPGGDVFEGVAIYNQLVAHDATVNVTIDGLAASIASVIAMAGDDIAIAKAGQMMIHPPSGVAWGTSADMRQLADLLDSIQGSITGVYADRTGRDADELKAWIDAETWMTAEQAVERGFADRIIENKTGDKKEPSNDAGERLQSFTAKNRRRLLELEAAEL